MSKGRKHNPIAPGPKAVDAPDAFEGQHYRIKQVFVKLEIDFYEADGRYKNTTYTDPPIPLSEADWPVGFEKLICSKAPGLKRGFRGDLKIKTKPVEQAETA